ncbi:hypothetical protein [Streptomyces sp. SID11385]|uniref:hypothetical protein n=1 Tax=Streptomyces sp. SID11385 TaxID=2706031 RepID=UPI0013CA2224|nr:hypothetical protein [Streptomyces sp. SID11385]NEA38739.1 hypothetical protein [Streptomyces sp. SID11385]
MWASTGEAAVRDTAVAHAATTGLPLVGYERGPALALAERAGFAKIGALRVWGWGAREEN